MSSAVPSRLVALTLALLLALPVTSCGRGGGGGSSLESPAYLPPDAVMASTIRFGDLAEALDAVMGMVETVLPPDELPDIERGIAELEERLGFRLREDLLGLLAREASFAVGIESVDLLAGQIMGGVMAGDGGLPPGILEIFQDVVAVVGITDIERFDESLRALLASGGGELRISEDGLRSLHGPPGELPFGLHYRPHGEYLVLGLAASAVNRAIERAESRAGLDRSADYRSLLERLGTGPHGFGYLNLPRIHELLESSVTVQGALVSDPQTEPVYRLFVPEEPWGSGMAWGLYRVEGGVENRSFMPREAFPLPGAFMGNFISVPYIGVIAAVAIPNMLNAVDRGKQKRTMADIRSIGTACEQFQIDNNAYPGPTEGLVPVEWLTPHVVPVYTSRVVATDGWGGPLLYWSDGGSYRILSMGKDGQQDWLPGLGGGGPTTSFDADVVFENGSFVQFPRGRQQ
jgi:general secretion pathway protein G